MQDLFMLDIAVTDHQQRLQAATRARTGASVDSWSHPVRVWVGERLIALGGALAGAAPKPALDPTPDRGAHGGLMWTSGNRQEWCPADVSRTHSVQGF
jgi:hypothetical protein